ncbi:hypothetical protein CBI33_17485 [Rhodococcus erythropolis]|jgi:pimeloyl-ACP methyl ester carboxylesterase|nr:hypothetical protein CBI33_17485 [Rhodococcus erythropolis]
MELDVKYPRSGRIPGTACSKDQRFSHFSFIPSHPSGRVAVLVHGSDRAAESLRELFLDWAETTGTTLLTPLFPAGIGNPADSDNYKSLEYEGIRFDRVLIDMLDDLAGWVELEFDPEVLLFGFSGGAQFAHRFFLVHPQRVLAVSIGAPGNVTLLDRARDWWVGIGNASTVFGHDIDLESLAAVPVQTVIGGNDDGRDVIAVTPEQPRWMPGANDAGVTRGDRIASLQNNYRRAGIDVKEVVIDSVSHQLAPMVTHVQGFFDSVLQRTA